MPKAVDLGVVDVLDVLTSLYSLSDGEVRGNEYALRCPDPAHDDHSASCSVNLETGYWHCFSCGKGGDLAGLGQVVLGLTRDEVESALSPGTAEALITQVRARLGAIRGYTREQRTSKLKLPGGYDSGPLTAMRSRGFTTATLKKWGVQFAAEQELTSNKGTKFTIKSSIAIPIRDENGRLLCWCYRRTDSSPGWQPKYLYSDGVEVSKLWYGLQHVGNKTDVTIVEGAIDTMWLDQCGIPALGLLGAGMTGGKMPAKKIMRLQRFKSITLLADNDPAGASWVHAIGSALGDRMHIRVCLYPKWVTGKDPNELSPVDVEILHATSVPWAKYRNR